MLNLSGSHLELIKAHAADAYPNECCGLIVGNYERREAGKLFPMKNGFDGSTRNRYRIDPKEHLSVEKQARATGQDVIGIYHSHPDVEARPSEFDREHAWPGYTYVIASVKKGRADQVRAWSLREDRSEFDEVKLNVPA